MILIAALLVGINAIVSQAVLIRELLVNFSGNELLLGIIFATWLTGGVIGSLLIAKRFIDRVKRPQAIFAAALSFLSVITPSILFLSRAARILFHIPIYEMIGPLQALLICALLLMPVSCLISICFLLCCKMLKDRNATANAAGTVYVLEALGATLAGVIFSFLLIRHFSPFQIVFGLMSINFLYILWLSAISKRGVFPALLLLIISIAAIALGAPQALDRKTQALQWYPQEVVAYENSPYGNISVTKIGEGFNFYENGALFFTTHDKAFNEEFAHLIMLQHPRPEKVLLIGNGIGGLLQELLQHNPQDITYLELDPMAIKIGKDFVSDKDREALLDPRIHIINEDGRFFIKRTEDVFDIIIVNLPDPTTLQLNRFYTEEFYSEAKKRLDRNGILAASVFSKEAIISNELARYNASVYKTLESAFSYVEFIPGENLIFVASDSPGIMDNRPQGLIDRFKQRGLKTEFLTTYHIKDAYYPHAVSYFKKRLTQQKNIAKINRDFQPICFYYDIILWAVMFGPSAVGFFNLLVNCNLYLLAAILILLFSAGLSVIRIKKDHLRLIIPPIIAASGAAGITLEMILILCFQISYGYVYEKVGLLIALFMLGAASGAYVINRNLKHIRDHLKLLCSVCIAFCVYIAAAPFIIRMSASMPTEAMQPIFYLMILGAGGAIGSQFPLAVAILQKKTTAANSAAVVWGSDLFGATLGTLVSSLVLMPVLGIFQTAVGYALLVGAGAILLFLSRQRLQQ
ncbi:MAG: fused MFS/spermidine synthase [Candidatus Omnitrophica bacterium]|nr:fused MFS/spermidine synthase [Candidatus Omnitrophota bacterium]